MVLNLIRRKLCILKGVYPREPKKKVKGGHHTYYHVKDIMFLKHEPLLEKLREMRAYDKKVKKAMSKKNRDLADRLLNRKPTYTLDMLVRERLFNYLFIYFIISVMHTFYSILHCDCDTLQVSEIH